MNKFVFALLLFYSAFASASGIKVENAWARATAPGQDTGMVELSITSDKNAELVGFSSSACKSPQMHSMKRENGMMKMREVDSIALPAGRPVDLELNGYHLMLVGLLEPLKEGEEIPLTLEIKVDGKMEKVKAAVKVRPLTGMVPMDMKRM